jgi:hypothetical protein
VPSQRGFGVINRRRSYNPEPVLLPTQALAERLTMRVQENAEALTTFRDYASRIPEPKTGTLDFKRWPFQPALYGDDVANAKEVVVMKGTQVGVSTWLIRSLLYWPDLKGMTGVYIFPKKVQLGEFVQQRIRPLVRNAEEYPRVNSGAIDNVFQKEIGLGWLNFRGSDVIDDLDSIDADILGFDEYDRLNQHNIEHAEHRVDASALGLLRRVGNPTVDEFGVSKAYDGSDQRQWMVKCPGCNDWQPLDFHKNVDMSDPDKPQRVCASCRKVLDVTRGEWVAQYPGRDVIGFHVNRLMVPWVNLRKIAANSLKRDPENRKVFFNKDLGVPYTDADDRLTIAHLKACQSILGPYSMPFSIESANPITMGVDIASKRSLRAIVSEWLDFDERKKKVLWASEVTRWYKHDPGEGPSLAELMDRYGVNMATFDHEPEYLTTRGFADAYPGRVFICNYAANQKDTFAIDVDMGTVSVRRTERIDLSFFRVRAQKVGLPMDLPTGFFDEMRAPVRIIEENDKGQRVSRYEKVGEFDDYAHADVYDDVAADVFAVVRGVENVVGGEDYSHLDDHLDFERSVVSDGESIDYSPGFDDPDLDDSWGYG